MDYNKLVRDNIINKIMENGEKPKFHILNDEDLLTALIAKIIEEGNEVLNSRTEAELVEELADLFEVILSIIKLKNISFDQIDYKSNLITSIDILLDGFRFSLKGLANKKDIDVSNLNTYIRYIYSFVAIYKIDMDLIKKVMEQKKVKKGGFEKGIFLESVEKIRK